MVPEGARIDSVATVDAVTALDADMGQPPPTYLTAFVGRQAELADLLGLLGRYRLVTITGSGGCGKTRLAREAFVVTARRWLHGVRWMDLDTVTEPAGVVEAAASAVGVLVDPSRGPRSGLEHYLRTRDVGVCFDNCEHVLDACAELVEALLLACPSVTVVATSREPLEVVGETVWRMPPMVEADAMELFTERARAVRPGYTSDPDGEDAVRTVCRRVDGIPLAIELAAAKVRVLTPSQIAAALDDRFRLLVRSTRGVVPRQQTLTASVEWSYDLLREDARVLLRRLAVFAGGFTLDQVRAVCADDGLGEADVLDALTRLVDASMVQVDEIAGTARYRLLETIRSYAAALLAQTGETVATRDRHLDHFIAVAEAATAALAYEDHDVVLAKLQVEDDNLRSALEWGLAARNPERGRRIAAALARYWYLRGHAHEGIRALERAVGRSADDESQLQGELYSGLALLTMPSGRLELIERASRRATEIGSALGDDRVLASAYVASAYLAFYVDFDRAGELARAVQRHAASADPFAADRGLLLEACTLTNRDRHDEAVRLARKLFERCQPRNERMCAAFSLSVQLWACLFTGDLRRAVALGNEAVLLAAPLQDYFTVGTNTVNLVWALGLHGDLRTAQALLDTVLRSVEDAGPDVDVVNMNVIAAKVAVWRGDPDAAARWGARAVQRADLPPDNWSAVRALPVLARAERRLGHGDEAREHAERAQHMAQRLGVPHALAEALDELAFLVAEHDPVQAEALHHEALRVRVDHGLTTFQVDSLDALALIAVAGERFVEGMRLLGASTAAREVIGYPRAAPDQADHEATVGAARAALGEDGFTDAWDAGAGLELGAAIAYATRARGPRRRPPTGWASLTPTELEVAGLVADGLTNPEIAARLFVSRATVKTHLNHTYSKLGVANRAELAAFVAARGAAGG